MLHCNLRQRSAPPTTLLRAGFRVHEKNGAVRIEIQPDALADRLRAGRVAAAVRELVLPLEAPRLVIDFSRVRWCSTAILGELLALNQYLAEQGGTLQLHGMRPAVRDVFAVTKLDQVLEILDHADDRGDEGHRSARGGQSE